MVFKTCARAVGEVIGSAFRMETIHLRCVWFRWRNAFAQRDGQGDFGNIGRDSACAMRYTGVDDRSGAALSRPKMSSEHCSHDLDRSCSVFLLQSLRVVASTRRSVGANFPDQLAHTR
jgi:hypothetical protein